MQGVLDAPVLAHDAEKLCRPVASGEQEVALDGLVAAALALDPGDRHEAGEIVLFGHLCRSDDGGADFLAAMTASRVVTFLACVALGLAMAALAFEAIPAGWPSRPVHSRRRARRSPRRYRAGNAAHPSSPRSPSGKELDQFQGAGRLVVAGRQRVGQRHAGPGAPRRHHHRRHVALAPLVGAPQSLAVERHHAIDLAPSRRTPS